MQRAIVFVLLVGLIAQGVYSSLLPEQVANHFGAAGLADGWMSNRANLLLSCSILVFNSLVFLSIPTILRNTPMRWLSLPNREYWLAPERRDANLRSIADWVGFCGLLTNLFMLVVFHLVYLANSKTPPRINEPFFLLLLGVYFLIICIWLVLLFRRFRLPASHPF